MNFDTHTTITSNEDQDQRNPCTDHVQQVSMIEYNPNDDWNYYCRIRNNSLRNFRSEMFSKAQVRLERAAFIGWHLKAIRELATKGVLPETRSKLDAARIQVKAAKAYVEFGTHDGKLLLENALQNLQSLSRSVDVKTLEVSLPTNFQKIWGHPYRLRISEDCMFPQIRLQDQQMFVDAPHGTNVGKLLMDWYKDQMFAVAPSVIQKWCRSIGVTVQSLRVLNGRPQHEDRHSLHSNCITLYSVFAKESFEYLDYAVLHEVLHLIVPRHNKKFYDLFDKFMPTWRDHKKTLNFQHDYRIVDGSQDRAP